MKPPFIHNRVIHSVVSRPSVPNTVKNCAGSDPTDRSPVRRRQRSTAQRNQNIASSVAQLFCGSRPTAILFEITERVIDAIEAVFASRWFSHVSVKILKPLPAIAYLDSSSAIISVLLKLRIIASLPHATPALVYPRLRHTVSPRLAVTTATARPGDTSGELTRSNQTEPAAIAPTQPVPVWRQTVFPLSNETHYQQSSKTLTAKISDFGTGLGITFPYLLENIRMASRHRVSSNNVDVRGCGAFHAPWLLFAYFSTEFRLSRTVL